MQKGYLILENGQAFPGVHCGAEADTVGELVFTTGMTGYLETLTDPSYLLWADRNANLPAYRQLWRDPRRF